MDAKVEEILNTEKRIAELGLDVPDFVREGYYGATYGSMKPFHIAGNLLFLSGHVPQRGTQMIFPGRLGANLTVEQGREAARVTGLNVIAGIKQAIGDLDRVKSLVRTLNFVVCTPEFTEVHKVSSGLSDLLAEVFGPERGIGGRATIGVMALAGGNCFETWATVELR
jgi:enamine deaminase RidA (YjgF/YER057c/UK114 family)